MNDLVVLRTDVNSGQRQTRGSGLIRTGLDARTGIYGSEGWGFEPFRARHRFPSSAPWFLRIGFVGVLVWPHFGRSRTVPSARVIGPLCISPAEVFGHLARGLGANLGAIRTRELASVVVFASVPRPCQNGRQTAVTSGRLRALRTASDVGMRRLTPCLKRPSKQPVSVRPCPLDRTGSISISL